MSRQRRRKFLLAAAVGAVVAVIDQLTKTWAVQNLARRDIHVLGTLRLRLTYNTGGAFSLGVGNPWLFVIAATVLLAVLLALGRRLETFLSAVALGLLLGGALGNLGDRVLRDTGGAVVDFIDLQWWPVFNLADASIVCGGILLFLASCDRRSRLVGSIT